MTGTLGRWRHRDVVIYVLSHVFVIERKSDILPEGCARYLRLNDNVSRDGHRGIGFANNIDFEICGFGGFYTMYDENDFSYV